MHSSLLNRFLKLKEKKKDFSLRDAPSKLITLDLQLGMK